MDPQTAESALHDRDGVIWLDGRFVPWREAALHALSHGLHYGGAVFDGIRVYEGRPFLGPEHCARLVASAAELGYDLEFSADELTQIVHDVVCRSGVDDGYVRLVAWRGSENLEISGRDVRRHVAIAAWTWDVPYGAARRSGISLGTSAWRRPPPEVAPVRAKASALYAISSLAKGQAEAAGHDDALLLDPLGNVGEATGANLFVVVDAQLCTPTTDYVLDGLTRRTVLNLAREIGMRTLEAPLSPALLARASEVFLTGTATEVVPVGRVDDVVYPVGPVTKVLAQAYSEHVRSAPSLGAAHGDASSIPAVSHDDPSKGAGPCLWCGGVAPGCPWRCGL